MPAIGIGLVWVAYSAGLWGYCLIRGYNVTPKQLLSPTWPPVPVSATSVGGKAVQAVGTAGAQAAGQAVGGVLNNGFGSGPVKAQ